MGYDAIRHARYTHRPGIFHAGQCHWADFHTQLCHGVDGQTDGRFYFRVQHVEVVVAGHAHLESAESPIQEFREVGDGDGHRAGVQRVVPGYSLEYQSTVADRPGHGADVVAVETGDLQAPLAHPPVGLLHANHAAKVGRASHRAAQVGAQRREGHAGRHVGAPSPTGASRNVVQVPGVVHRPVVEVVGGGSGGKLLQVLLAQDDGPGLFHPCDHQCVLFRHMVGQYLGANGGLDVGGGDVVFDPDGNTVQWPPVLPPHQRRLLLLRLGPRLVVEQGDERVQFGLKPIGLRQRGLG